MSVGKDEQKNMRFALFFGNRGFFPEHLIAQARKELSETLREHGYDSIMLDASLTKYGAVETEDEGLIYADFLEKERGNFDGVILCLPNFGDENGAVIALRNAGVPILIQAYPDEKGKMDFDNRRDAFCGKFSIMDVFRQYNVPFTIFKPHTVHPKSEEFAEQLHDFATICRVVKGMSDLRIGALGARTSAFKTVRFDEITLQKYGITTEVSDLSEIIHRVKNFDRTKPAFQKKKDFLQQYTDCSAMPAEKMDTQTALSCVLDEIIDEKRLDALSLRCWDELQVQLGISPCMLLSELNNRGITAACELDVCNGIAMHALKLATQSPASVLDWNNNYDDDPDKCILFHCGPVPTDMMVDKGKVTDHRMIAKSYGEGKGWGTIEGRIKPQKITYASAKTEDGKLQVFVGEGEFTNDPIENGFFGCGGVVQIDNLQEKLLNIGHEGYRHHVSVSEGRAEHVLREAFDTYLKYSVVELG